MVRDADRSTNRGRTTVPRTANRSGGRDEERHARNQGLVRDWRAACESGDGTAAAILATVLDENAGLAIHWARRYRGVCVQDDFETLAQIARDGLEHAVRTWDPNGGAALSTWSTQPIRSRLQRRVVALYGRRLAPVARLVVSTRLDLEAELARPARLEEVAARCGLVEERVAAVEAEVAAIRRRARGVRLDDRRTGDRHERITGEPPAVPDRRDGPTSLSVLVEDAALPRRWRRMVHHLMAGGRSLPLEEAVASYAERIGASADEVAAELAELVDHLRCANHPGTGGMR